MSKISKFLETFNSKDTYYECSHGRSYTYYCPDCFKVIPLVPVPDRTADFKMVLEQGE